MSESQLNPKGTLFIIGGHEDKSDCHHPEILDAVLHAIGKKKVHIEIVTTASGEAKESFKDYEEIFTKLGVEKVTQIHHNSRAEALEPQMFERASAADAYFFAGGDQLKLTSIYGGTPFLTKIKERYIHEKII